MNLTQPSKTFPTYTVKNMCTQTECMTFNFSLLLHNSILTDSAATKRKQGEKNESNFRTNYPEHSLGFPYT